MADKEQSLPNYENPPVVEVVCGVQFKPIEQFNVAHIGLLWQRFQPEYVACKEQNPLPPVIEQMTVPPPEQPLHELQIFSLPRIWYVNKNESHVIQVQRDRFLTNWKKTDTVPEYPRYGAVIENFQTRLKEFRSFLVDCGLKEPEPLQYEMTYVNVIPIGEGWSSVGNLSELFPDFNFRKADRFLNAPESINWTNSFRLPGESGRLHCLIANGWRKKVDESQEQVIQFSLTARGIGEYKSWEQMPDWFDTARKWIVRSFADLTDEKIQREIWKRTQ
jgi:uncharacterized protein (TIGR04255 family)